MLYINVTLTVRWCLIPMPIIAIGTRLITKKLHRQYQDVQASFSDLTEEVRERFAGIRILKAYNLQNDSESRILEGIRCHILKETLKLARLNRTFFSMMMFLTELGTAIVIYFGGRLTIFSEITPGDFVAFISYLGILTWPMMAIWLGNKFDPARQSIFRQNRSDHENRTGNRR